MILNEQVQAKWKPILEHEELPNIDDNYKKSVTAILLENQEKMMREQAMQQNGAGLFLTENPNGAPMGSGMDASNYASGGDGQTGMNPLGLSPGDTGYSTQAAGSVQWVDPVLISLVRRTMPKLLAYDVCGVQPMTSPVGLVFAMRSQYGAPGQLPNEGYTGAPGSRVSNMNAQGVEEVFFGEAGKLNAGSGNAAAQSAFNSIRWIVTVGWAIYPIGYVLGMGDAPDMANSNLIYNLADFINKIAFGLAIYVAAISDNE